MARKLEVCAYNIESCLHAAAAGASRIELCASPAEGGVTPSYGMIEHAVQNLSIPVYIMIRPRGGNFVYSEAELDIMFTDIARCKDLSVPGIAIGILKADNTVDVERMKEIVQFAFPMGITFHKAFDRTPDAMQALEDVIATGCERILTSGLQPTATEGTPLIKQLILAAGNRITIMPGGGVRSTNIAQIAAATGATELHSSAITAASRDFVADKNEVAALVTAINF